ncbi:MAG: alpha/beta fold hydrolase [Micrococcales bacterium]|nr:alpha/beta fold hydrolase [Micrococcales bacterium]
MSADGARAGVARAARIAGVTGAGIGLASAAGSLGAGTYLARLLLTPERERPEIEEILGIDGDTITLRATEETVVPGRYGLWFDRGAGHLRLGEILAMSADGAGGEGGVGDPAGWVTRRIDAVDAGIPRPGAARWDGYYYSQSPQLSLGLTTYDVTVASDIGDLPAWLVPGDTQSPGEPWGGRWAILVHGRGATRHECLRAVPVLYRIGITSLIPTYRNDADGAPSPDGLYNLGLSEWRDLEAAIAYALAHGAQDIVLMGWSMGGAIVLQTLDRSPLGRHVSCAVLDSPVIDWADVIAHQARLRRVPRALAQLAKGLLGARWSRRLVGVHEPLDVARTDWQNRAAELRHPVLLIHSADDEFVPVGPSRELAARRRDLVTYVEWRGARHVKEWNLDAPAWERVVADYLCSCHA